MKPIVEEVESVRSQRYAENNNLYPFGFIAIYSYSAKTIFLTLTAPAFSIFNQ